MSDTDVSLWRSIAHTGVSFGATRELAFLRASALENGDKVKIYFPQTNNGVFSFGRDVNILFKHGVNALPEEEQDGKGYVFDRVLLRCCVSFSLLLLLKHSSVHVFATQSNQHHHMGFGRGGEGGRWLSALARE